MSNINIQDYLDPQLESGKEEEPEEIIDAEVFEVPAPPDPTYEKDIIDHILEVGLAPSMAIESAWGSIFDLIFGK